MVTLLTLAMLTLNTSAMTCYFMPTATRMEYIKNSSISGMMRDGLGSWQPSSPALCALVQYTSLRADGAINSQNMVKTFSVSRCWWSVG